MTLIRPFRPEDATAVSEIVVRCLREVNSRDYPPDLITRMCDHFTADRIRELAVRRQMFVATTDDGTIAGTVSRDGNKVYTMFVLPRVIGQGVGRSLMTHIETLAAAEGHDHMETGASITGHGFYHRLGYTDVRTSETDFGLNYILRKPLGPEPAR